VKSQLQSGGTPLSGTGWTTVPLMSAQLVQRLQYGSLYRDRQLQVLCIPLLRTVYSVVAYAYARTDIHILWSFGQERGHDKGGLFCHHTALLSAHLRQG
jgi:hypothetical protein